MSEDFTSIGCHRSKRSNMPRNLVILRLQEAPCDNTARLRDSGTSALVAMITPIGGTANIGVDGQF